MYVPQPFRAGDAEAVRLIREHAFATVFTVVEGAPLVSYLPCVVLEAQPELVIGAHFARANPHWRSVEAHGALLLFAGPHGYVSPRWYVDPARNVPTWNYAAVHAQASAQIADAAQTLDIVKRLARENEGVATDAWTVEAADPAYIAAQLRGIVGVRFTVAALEAKFKLSQNREAADRDGAIAGLRASANAANRDLAELMERV